MKRKAFIAGVVSILLVTTIACASPEPAAETAAEFYQGKTIDWIVSSDPGSTTDLFTRAVAPYLAAATGAKVLVRDMLTEEGINVAYTESL